MRQLYCVLGDPIAHSRSPAIHARAFQLLGVDAAYVPCRVRPGQLADAVRGLRALGAAGFNVTVPHKGAVATLCDRLSLEAERAGAVNCVVRAPEQRAASGSLGHNTIREAEEAALVGHNTDGPGLLSALRGKGVSIEGARVVVLGAGGAARAAATALAGRAERVDVVNRRLGNATTLSLQLRAAGTQSRAAALGADEPRAWLAEADLVVQCTTVGMGTAESIIDPALLGPKSAVCDLVYAGAAGSAPGDTALLLAARARGLRVVDGIDVLVHQAIRSLELWLDKNGLDRLHGELRAAALGANLETA